MREENEAPAAFALEVQQLCQAIAREAKELEDLAAIAKIPRNVATNHGKRRAYVIRILSAARSSLLLASRFIEGKEE